MNILSVFIEGLLSFFSPCVLPLIPVYIGYLSGGTLNKSENGQYSYDRKKVIINTIFFVFGISMAFFILGFGLSSIGRFFIGNQFLFAKIGGVIVIILGLYQLGFLGTSKVLSRDYRLPVHIENMAMSPVTAIIMGFIISFAWTPCIGPILSSVLIMAATADSSASGFGLIFVYTLGYIIPFILVGFFANTLINFFSKHKDIVKYTVKIGGALLVLMGILMFTGKMNSITGYLSATSGNSTTSETTEDIDNADENNSDDTNADEDTPNDATTDEETENTQTNTSDTNTEIMVAADFSLKDQYGNTHTLSDYKGKYVFLNFWATWCPPCREEMPYIQALYEEYQEMDDSDVVFLGVAFPELKGWEQDVAGITNFLNENEYTYPVVMDEEASLYASYYITAYPTTFIIGPDGNVSGYVLGGMSKENMETLIEKAKNNTLDLNDTSIIE